ncbi:SDR family oxidoreductase [Pseudomonas sp. GL-RE-19]|jgi:NAD(P)-dependent dehydrogenase (short-subunit alcohol dehydrogenase family)|uniref:SDR family oxidoreductase n=1 Tax=Pseudomonas sp. GL-RE-19 TaxID=2832389 RepID=UPI001CBBF5C3|nr:SDR family oxidoreductase [Pseudomonas sp. GL-RE-19]
MNLNGKVAIITGSTQGLGVDIAKQMLSAGAKVMLVGRNAVAGRSLVDELGEASDFCACNVELDEDIDDCIESTLARFGRIDILVNNACMYVDKGIDSTREQWHQTLSVNLISSAIFSQKVSPHLTEGGVIINMGSTGGKFGAAGRALYPASKAAIIQMTKNFAVTLAPKNIRVLCVSPAWTWSPSVAELSGDSIELADAVGAALHPLGRIGRGKEVAKVVTFLCTDSASWMTGVDIPVDGGFSILGPDQGISPRTWFQKYRDSN